MRSSRIAIFTLAVLSSLWLAWIFSPATIIPPSDPAAAIAVYVVDYGWHSRLILPTGNGELFQYAYGDWNYFALNQQNWRNGAAALLLPTQGALGRRKFRNLTEFQRTIEQGNYTLLSFVVSRVKVMQLLKSLEEHFNRNTDRRVENPQTGLTLVHYDREYTMFHNSNHELVLWLQDLDCRVEGFVMWANFQVKSP